MLVGGVSYSKKHKIGGVIASGQATPLLINIRVRPISFDARN
jgi:hypothetical protein